jgi:hypothetical protein
MIKPTKSKTKRGYDERGRRVFRDSDGKFKRILFEILMLVLILGPVVIAVYSKLR